MTQFKELAFAVKGNSLYMGYVRPGINIPTGRKSRLLGDDCILYGYAGKKGCFSVRKVGDLLDVAFYTDATPEELTEVDLYNALYELYPTEAGWGFAVCSRMKELMVLNSAA